MRQIVLAKHYPIWTAEYTRCASAKPGNQFWYMHKIVLANYMQIRLAEYTECPLCRSGENISPLKIYIYIYIVSALQPFVHVYSNSNLLVLRNDCIFSWLAEWIGHGNGAWSSNYDGQIHHRCKRCEHSTWSDLELVQKNVNLPVDREGWRLSKWTKNKIKKYNGKPTVLWLQRAIRLAGKIAIDTRLSIPSAIPSRLIPTQISHIYCATIAFSTGICALKDTCTRTCAYMYTK